MADNIPGPWAAGCCHWANTFTVASSQGTDLLRVGIHSYSSLLCRSPSDGGRICMAIHQQCWQRKKKKEKKRVARQIWAVGGFSYPVATWPAACNSPSSLSFEGFQPLFSTSVLPLSRLYLFLGQSCLYLTSSFLTLPHGTTSLYISPGANSEHSWLSSSNFQCSTKTPAFSMLKVTTHLSLRW